MKKTLIIVILFLTSCNGEEKTIVLTDFNTVFYDSLVPKNNNIYKSYTSYTIKIKGFVNDSVKFKFYNGKDATPFFFNGNIDERFMFDYYGRSTEHIFFDPYKATEGKLDIKYGLY